MNFKKSIISAVLLSTVIPLVTFAQTLMVTGNTPVERLIGRAIGWVNTAIPVLITIATIFFIVAVIQFIREKDAGKMAERRQQMLNGVIGLFVIIAIWGIVALISNSFEIGTGGLNPRDVPCPPGQVYSVTYKRCM